MCESAHTHLRQSQLGFVARISKTWDHQLEGKQYII